MAISIPEQQKLLDLYNQVYRTGFEIYQSMVEEGYFVETPTDAYFSRGDGATDWCIMYGLGGFGHEKILRLQPAWLANPELAREHAKEVRRQRIAEESMKYEKTEKDELIRLLRKYGVPDEYTKEPEWA